MAAKKRKLAPLLSATAIASMPETRRVHVLNKRAIRNYKALGDAVGLRDMGVHLVRINPGDESTEYHTHYCDEEFVFVLEGRGVTEIGGRKHKIGPGDFMGFTAPSEPHAISNPYNEPLVYLLGGTRKAIDISEYPRSRKRAYKFDGKRHTVKFEDVEER
ncbi:MAG: hypothetical protein JWN94_4859 [Betaproteobacteria bacterium]|jgi:uncharacterized cupin superfamily protein|nr:hypothetical protein [Betaproteobacteria bacterium]